MGIIGIISISILLWTTNIKLKQNYTVLQMFIVTWDMQYSTHCSNSTPIAADMLGSRNMVFFWRLTLNAFGCQKPNIHVWCVVTIILGHMLIKDRSRFTCITTLIDITRYRVGREKYFYVIVYSFTACWIPLT